MGLSPNDPIWHPITFNKNRERLLNQQMMGRFLEKLMGTPKLSNSLDTEFCLDDLEIALGDGRKPEILNSDQGCQFSSGDFVARLQAEEIRISWSGRKRCYDNILVEWLWRTVKHEEVYLRAYSDGWEAEISLARFLWMNCHARPHSSLRGRTPQEVYTKIEPCSTRPGLTMSGAGTVE